LWSLFPRWETAVAAVIVGAVLLSLRLETSSLERKVNTLKRENSRAAWAKGKKPSLLESVNKKLKSEVVPFSYFVTDRFPMAGFLEEFSRRMPDGVAVVQIAAEDQIWVRATGAGAGQRSAQFRFGVPLTPEGRIPRQIDETLAQIRSSPFFEKYLPRVQLSALNSKKDAGIDMAFAGAVCLPKDPKQVNWEYGDRGTKGEDK